MSMPATDTPATERETELALRASLGAAGFDRIEPGWFTPDRIDLLTLDVGNPFTCPIGQVFKDRGGWNYVDTAIQLIDPEHGSEGGMILASSLYRHGFEISPSASEAELSELNGAWIREILTRRNSREAAVTINS